MRLLCVKNLSYHRISLHLSSWYEKNVIVIVVSFLPSVNAKAFFPQYPSIWKNSTLKLFLNDMFSLNKVSSRWIRMRKDIFPVIFWTWLDVSRNLLPKDSFGLKYSKEMYSGTKFPSCLMFSKSGLKGYPAAETLK